MNLFFGVIFYSVVVQLHRSLAICCGVKPIQITANHRQTVAVAVSCGSILLCIIFVVTVYRELFSEPNSSLHA